MAKKQLHPNVSIRTEHGAHHPQAYVVIDNIDINNVKSLNAGNIGDDYQEAEEIAACTYEVQYYCSQSTMQQKYPIAQLKSFELDGDDVRFSSLLSMNVDNAQVKQVLDGDLPLQEKIIAAIKVDLTVKSR